MILGSPEFEVLILYTSASFVMNYSYTYICFGQIQYRSFMEDAQGNDKHFSLVIRNNYKTVHSTNTADALQWRQMIVKCGVSNYRPIECLFSSSFRLTAKKHERSALLPFVRGIHRWPVDSPHKGTATQKMFPFDDVIVGYPQLDQVNLLRVHSLIYAILAMQYRVILGSAIIRLFCNPCFDTETAQQTKHLVAFPIDGRPRPRPMTKDVTYVTM